MNGDAKVTRAVERASQQVRRYLAAHHDQLGVTEIEAHLLARLAAKGPCTVAAIQQAFGLRPSTLTNALDRLERRGFLLRQLNPADRRTFLLALTPPGLDAARQVIALVDDLERRVAERVSAEQLAAFHAVVAALEDQLRRRPCRVLIRPAGRCAVTRTSGGSGPPRRSARRGRK